jgi:hypothetical protein
VVGRGVGVGEAEVGVNVITAVGVVEGMGVGRLPFRVDTTAWLAWEPLEGLAALAMPQIVAGATTMYRPSTIPKTAAG